MRPTNSKMKNIDIQVNYIAYSMGDLQIVKILKSLDRNIEQHSRSKNICLTYLQHLHNHVDDVSDGVLRPKIIRKLQ